MNRRSFLLGTGTLALSQLAAGCGAQNQAVLRVELLKGSIPSQLVNEFRQNLDQLAQVKFAPIEQLQALFDKLGKWQQQTNNSNDRQFLPSLPFIKPTPALPPDLVTLGDYWLAPAIQQKLIRPLEPARLKRLSALPSEWQKLVRRNDQGQLDSQGRIWAAPYRWGSTVIAYNRDKFKSLGWTPKDWSDIWRPELRDRVSLLDQPREVIGLTLKKLGQSYNLNNLDIPNLREELRTLHQQVKFYSSDSYMQPLVLADTWLAVGWSTDVLPVVQRYQHLASVVPQSGTSLWADLWVRPTGAAFNTSLSEKWIDFCWQPQTAQQISLLSKATSPIPVKNEAGIQKGWQMTFANPEFQQSEFLLPLPETTVEQYQSLWQEMRS